LVILAANLLAAVWAATGGVVTYDSYVYQDQSNNDGYAPYVRAEVRGTLSKQGVPYLYEHYSRRPSYSLRLIYITHTLADDPSLIIDKVFITYEDGSGADLQSSVPERIAPSRADHIYIDDDHIRHEVPSLRAEVMIAGCVDRILPFTLSISGQLRSRDKICEPFDYRLELRPRRSKLMTTRWFWDAGE
jgi:hypothetical protein